MTRSSMSHAKTIGLLILIVILQLLCSRYIPFFAFVDLLMIITLYFAMTRGELQGALMGTVSGLLKDSLTNLPLGMYGFAYTLVGFLVASASRKLILERNSLQFLVLFLSALVNSFTLMALIWVVDFPIRQDAGQVALLHALLTSAAGILFFGLFRRIEAVGAERRIKGVAHGQVL